MSGTCDQTIEDAHTLNIADVAIDNNNPYAIYTGSRDYYVKGWDIETGQNIVSFSEQQNIVTTMKFSRSLNEAENNLLYQGAEDLCIRAWDTRQNAQYTHAAIHITQYTYFPLSLDTHPINYNLLVTGSKGFNSVGCELKVWDVRHINTPLLQFHGHSQDVTKVKFSTKFPDIILSCSKDGSIFAWKLNSMGSKSGSDNNINPIPSASIATCTSKPIASHQATTCSLTSLDIIDEKLLKTEDHKLILRINFAVGAFDGTLLLMSLIGVDDQWKFQFDFTTRAYYQKNDYAES